MTDSDEPEADHLLGGYTVIFDKLSNRPVMRIGGVVVLPIGASVELDTSYNAPVVGVRLLAPSGTPGDMDSIVCIDVEVPEGHWKEAKKPR